MKQRRYVMLFGDTSPAVDELDDAAAGRLFKAVLRYAQDRREVPLSGEERFVYRMLMAQFARDEDAYRRKSDKNRRYREKRPEKTEEDQKSLQYKEEDEDQYQEKEKDEDEDEDKEGHTSGGFDPPTPQEVRSYCQAAGLSFDADRFCDYHAARGWMLGGRPMTDWKAAARVWASRGDRQGSGTSPTRPARLLSEQNYAQREYTNSLDALDLMMARWAGETPP